MVGRKERREIAATVDDAHDLDSGVADAIEDHGRIDNDRSDAGDKLVARDAHLRKLRQIGSGAIDVA